MAQCACSIKDLNSYGTRTEAWGLSCVRCGKTVDAQLVEDLPRLIAELEAEEQEAQRLVEEERQRQEQAAIAAEEEKLASEIDQWRTILSDNLSSGEQIYSYRSIYIPTDSLIQGEVVGNFDILPIRLLGIMGWRVVSVIPRTSGEALKNLSTAGSSWGAGMGGNVLGVHVLLERLGTSEESNVFEEGLEVIKSLMRNGTSSAQIRSFFESSS